MRIGGPTQADSTKVYGTGPNECKGHGSGMETRARQHHGPVNAGVDGQLEPRCASHWWGVTLQERPMSHSDWVVC